jgi:hypothetical protein
MEEAYALRDGLSLPQHLGSNNLINQSDNMPVTKTMKEGYFSSKSSDATFEACRFLALGFKNITFEHCNREAN